MPTRGPDGRFHREDGEEFGTYVDDKGYPRISAGPLKGVRVHTLVAEAMLGRKLLPTEDAHHKDENKLNPHWTNLEVIDHKAHGAHSQKSAYLRRHLEMSPKSLEQLLQAREEDAKYDVPF